MTVIKSQLRVLMLSLFFIASISAIYLSVRFYIHQSTWQFETVPSANYKQVLPENYQRFVIIGDTQRTSWQEYLLFHREINDDEQETLINELSQETIDFLVILGDLVFDAASPYHWQYFDYLFQNINQKQIPIYPLMGNHEYWGDQDRADKHISERFPLQKSQIERKETWYALEIDGLGLIFVDSNKKDLPKGAWKKQKRFVKGTLEKWQDQADIKMVLLFSHHPAYSNKPDVKGTKKVRKDLAPLFCQYDKTKLFVAGHAHGYERFDNTPKQNCEGRWFVVSGGGGGPRPSAYLDSSERGLVDYYPIQGKRPLNYLLVEKQKLDDEFVLNIKVKGLIDKKIQVIDEFTLSN